MTVLPKGMQFIGTACSIRSRLRYLKQVCRRQLNQNDAEARAARGRVKLAVVGTPQPEYAYLIMVNRARVIEEETGESWVTALHYVVAPVEEALKPHD